MGSSFFASGEVVPSSKVLDGWVHFVEATPVRVVFFCCRGEIVLRVWVYNDWEEILPRFQLSIQRG